jgi:hypothetical protein
MRLDGNCKTTTDLLLQQLLWWATGGACRQQQGCFKKLVVGGQQHLQKVGVGMVVVVGAESMTLWAKLGRRAQVVTNLTEKR